METDVDVTIVSVYTKLARLEKLLLGVQETQGLMQEDLGTLTEGIQELGERIQEIGNDYGDGFQRYKQYETEG